MHDGQDRNIRSFVRREGRLTKAQKYALDHYWEKHGIEYQPALLNIDEIFKRRAPLVVDIGVGTGDSTLKHAQLHPENNYLAIEVHRPGIGHLLNQIESNNLPNIKIINHDVIEILKQQIPNQTISQILIFFPDPWPKKRHHKRRLINPNLLTLIKRKLSRHGRLYIATDWEDYAEHIQLLFNQDTSFFNLAGSESSSPRPAWRIPTRYESRGLRLDHKVWDFCYSLNSDKR